MFECRLCPSLRAQLADQQELMLRMTQAHAEERKALVDQLISVTRPESLRELRRPIGALEPSSGNQAAPRRISIRPNFPGFEPDLRPLRGAEEEADN